MYSTNPVIVPAKPVILSFAFIPKFILTSLARPGVGVLDHPVGNVFRNHRSIPVAALNEQLDQPAAAAVLAADFDKEFLAAEKSFQRRSRLCAPCASHFRCIHAKQPAGLVPRDRKSVV